LDKGGRVRGKASNLHKFWETCGGGRVRIKQNGRPGGNVGSGAAKRMGGERPWGRGGGKHLEKKVGDFGRWETRGAAENWNTRRKPNRGRRKPVKGNWEGERAWGRGSSLDCRPGQKGWGGGNLWEVGRMIGECF